MTVAAKARLDLDAKRRLMGHATRDIDGVHYAERPPFLQEEIHKITIPLAPIDTDGAFGT